MASWRQGKPRAAWGSPKRFYKAPTDYTKPQQTTDSPDRLYKAPTDNTKPPKDNTKPQKDYTKTQNIRQNPKIFNKPLK